jgi:hypothetical protein
MSIDLCFTVVGLSISFLLLTVSFAIIKVIINV